MLPVKHLKLKLLYIFILAAICSISPYMSLFLSKVLLIKEERIGFLLSITPFIEFLSSGIWTVCICFSYEVIICYLLN